MARPITSRLSEAVRRRCPVNFMRPFDPGPVLGYVLSVGPRFFLVGLIDDRIRLNGFACYRLSDVRKLNAPHQHAVFVERALRKRGERRPKKPRVNMTGLEDMLLTANARFPLITIHRERVDPDVCHIGSVVRAAAGRLSLLEISPDADWDETPTEYRLREITRVDFGGGYEEALHLVGGTPDQVTTDRHPKPAKRRQ